MIISHSCCLLQPMHFRCSLDNGLVECLCHGFFTMTFERLVKEHWSNSNDGVFSSLIRFVSAMGDWNRKVFGIFFGKKNTLWKTLEVFRNCLHSGLQFFIFVGGGVDK